MLDDVEVLRHERARDDEVVVEAFVGGWTDTALGAGKQIRHRGRKQVSGAVAKKRQRLRTSVRDDTDGGVALEAMGQVDQAAVHDPGERGFREPGRDLCRHVEDRRSCGHSPIAPVRQCDVHVAHGD